MAKVALRDTTGTMLLEDSPVLERNQFEVVLCEEPCRLTDRRRVWENAGVDGVTDAIDRGRWSQKSLDLFLFLIRIG